LGEKVKTENHNWPQVRSVTRVQRYTNNKYYSCIVHLQVQNHSAQSHWCTANMVWDKSCTVTKQVC